MKLITRFTLSFVVILNAGGVFGTMETVFVILGLAAFLYSIFPDWSCWRFFGKKKTVADNSDVYMTRCYKMFESEGQFKAIGLDSIDDNVTKMFISSGYVLAGEIYALNEMEAVNNYLEIHKRKQAEKEFELDRLKNIESLLDKANGVIRAANKRVADLKLDIVKKNIEISELKCALNEIKGKEIRAEFNDNDWLGVNEEYDLNELRKNYKKLVQVYHPDKGGCHVIMTRINVSYGNLLKRAKS